MLLKRKAMKRAVTATCCDVITSLLDVADAAVQRLANAKDEEALHDFRVSLRQLRAFLRAYTPWLKGVGPKKARKQFDEIMTSTNAGRDDQVHLAWIDRQLRRKRLSTHLRDGLKLMCRDIKSGQTRTDPTSVPILQSSYAQADRRLRDKLADVTNKTRSVKKGKTVTFAVATAIVLRERTKAVRKRLKSLTKSEHWRDAHDLRIRGKHLRYLIEPIEKCTKPGGAILKDLKSLQNVLGDLHDLQVLEHRTEQALRQVAENDPESHDYEALTALIQHIGREQRRLQRKLDRKWLTDGNKPFFDGCRALINELSHITKS